MNLRNILISILANAQGKYMKKPEINKQVYKFRIDGMILKHYTAESVGRELRRMQQKGIIEKDKNSFHARYKYVGKIEKKINFTKNIFFKTFKNKGGI